MLSMLGDGIFNQESAAWKHSRDMLRPPLQHKQFEDLQVFKQSVQDLIDVLSGQSSVIKLQLLFFRMTLDVTTEFLFGESVESLKTPESAGKQNFSQAFNTAQDIVSKHFQLDELYWMKGGSTFTEACHDVYYFADQIIDCNLSRSSEKRRVFPDVIAESAADRNALRGQIINTLVAGRDSTACLLTWTFFMLVRHRF